MEGGVIDVTRESVNQILGFPLGKTKFSSLPFRTADDNSYEKWTEHFDNNNIIRLKWIKMKIVSRNKSDMNFKLNFLALLINSLIETSSSGKANIYPIQYITKKTEIKNIDWCSYLIDSLVKIKESFDQSSSTAFFNGPSAYLVLLYVDRVSSEVLKVKRTRLVICHWTTEKVKMREDYEKEEIGEFGTGELNEEFIQEELNEEKVNDDDVEFCDNNQGGDINDVQKKYIGGKSIQGEGEEIKKRRSSRISNMVKEIPQNVESVAKVAKRSSSLKKYIKDKNFPHCEKETAARGKYVEMQETNDKKVEDPVKDKNAHVKVKKR
ncbi:unnamed protein product [Lactuca virosa]|uniref:Ulp1-like peptidase n=1 Tax=Lactuca virosa TaxID=75947 RepID=A0AAU9NKL4_9ASTR|nr:unnamed protein product [Lactuca virosa]